MKHLLVTGDSLACIMFQSGLRISYIIYTSRVNCSSLYIIMFLNLKHWSCHSVMLFWKWSENTWGGGVYFLKLIFSLRPLLRHRIFNVLLFEIFLQDTNFCSLLFEFFYGPHKATSALKIFAAPLNTPPHVYYHYFRKESRFSFKECK